MCSFGVVEIRHQVTCLYERAVRTRYAGVGGGVEVLDHSLRLGGHSVSVVGMRALSLSSLVSWIRWHASFYSVVSRICRTLVSVSAFCNR